MPGQEMIASGRVQGVGFRWFVRACARQNGIRGYVRNEPDGTVRIVAVGSAEDLLHFANDVRQGTRHALVSQLSVADLANYTDYEDFFIA